VVTLASLLFQVNLPLATSVRAATDASAVSTDTSTPEHGRALGVALSDDSVRAAFKALSEDGRRPQVGRPSFIHVSPDAQNTAAAGDMYIVTFKSDKDELHQAFVTVIVDITNRTVAAATIWYGDATDVANRQATLRMVEFRSGKVTHDRWMSVDGVHGKAYDEHGRELKNDQVVGFNAFWGTPAAAETISTCDVVSTIYWAMACTLACSFFTGFIGSVIAGVVCALVALVVTVWVCTQIEVATSP
jgi:hypothetical protein